MDDELTAQEISKIEIDGRGRLIVYPKLFQLAAEESGSIRSQIGALKAGRGKHRKYAAYVFTEQGMSPCSPRCSIVNALFR
jgi:hypothetical protein